jgi:urocanate reductase
MNKLKRILALILILCFVLTFAGCGKTETETIKPEEEVKEEAAISFTPGTYTGKGVGFSGEVVIDVTFSEDAITDIKLVSSMETDHVGTPAFDIMFEAIKTHTSTGVDAVSGATLTSNAVLRAVEDAAAQAGCDKNNLRVGKIPYELNAGEKIVDTFDVVVVGAGGAGITAAAAAAQNGASVCIIEKEAEVGGNTLVSGCSFQAVLDCLVWDPKDPDATTGVYEYTGETFEKSKSDKGRLDTLRMILNWSEEPFNERVEDPDAIKSVNDYNLPNRGVHPEYLETLKTLKQQIRAYLDWAEPKLAAGAKETDLTLFSTVELHIFQTYYGGLRLNNDKTKWIYSDYDLVHQLCTEILPTKEWLMDQGSLFQNAFSTRTLIGCLWQRINSFDGGMVSGEKIEGRWGTYFAVPLNTIMNANEKNTIMTRTKATELITDEEGRVTGVKAVKYDGTEVEITANMGVILATGGYAYNREMVIETNDYWDKDDLKPDILSTNRPLSMGEGIIMAQQVGAATKGMDFTQLMPLGWVDTGHLAGGTGENIIYISPAGTSNAGKRYVDESAERDVLCQGAFDYGGEKGLFVEISNAGNRTKENNVEGRLYICTLKEAAEMLELDEETIKNTIIEYDDAVRTDTLHELDVPKSAVL